MNLTALSNRELANIAEADPRYLADPLFTALVNRLPDDDGKRRELDPYDPANEKGRVERVLAGTFRDTEDESSLIDHVLNLMDEVADNATPLVESLPYLECTRIPGGPIVRAQGV